MLWRIRNTRPTTWDLLSIRTENGCPYEYDKNDNITRLTDRGGRETSYEYDPLNSLTQVRRPDGTVSSYTYNARNQVLEAKNTCVCGFLISDYQYTYDEDGNRAFQLNYNSDAECGYGKNVSGEIFMPEYSHNEDGSLTAEGELFGYICSATGRAYDLTEYVNDTNREHTEVLTAFNINTGFDTESYTYAGSSRLSRNNIWNEARDVNHDEMSCCLYDGQGSFERNRKEKQIEIVRP